MIVIIERERATAHNPVNESKQALFQLLISTLRTNLLTGWLPAAFNNLDYFPNNKKRCQVGV
jgi:hypothetical protein